MKDHARTVAYRILIRIDAEKAYSNLSLNQEIGHAKLDARDRGLVTELVYGVLRMRGHLDYIINQFSKRPVDSLEPGVRNILRLGLYQMRFMDKIPVSAAVNTAVELAKSEFHEGIAKFVNGVLRNIDRGMAEVKFPDATKDPVGYISTYYSHPHWLVEKWLARFGYEETVELCDTNNQVPDLTIRVNTLKADFATLADDLAEKYNFDVFLLAYPYEGLLLENATGFTETEEFKNGYFTVQGQASMLVSHALKVEHGMKVADLCAAPGGKTAHIAALMENTGEVLAVDIHPHKIELIEDNCRRLGVTNVKTMCADTSSLELEADQFDRILLDAPCSGLGLLAQKPEIRWAKTPEEIRELAALQKTLLKKSLTWLKPGGIIVYSTCTITPEENQEVVDEVLSAGGVNLLDLRKLLPAEEQEIFAENGYDTPYLEFLPHISETEGFFIAALQKKS